jgi:hypothetical protein
MPFRINRTENNRIFLMGPGEIKIYGFTVKSNDVLKVKKSHDEASVERHLLRHWQSFVFTGELYL